MKENCDSKYNFDEVIDRQHQNSKKWIDWSGLGLKEIKPDVLPMWIADMDFKCEQKILEALKKPIQWGVIGYDAACSSFYDSFIKWQKDKNDWDIKKEWLVPTPGVVPGIANAIRTFTKEHDKILIQPPVYYPFFSVIETNDRVVVENNLIYDEDKYRIDFEDLKEKIKDCKMMILCSPHNPIGRVWSVEELTQIVEICIENNVILVSDEIHSDLLLFGNKHVVSANLPNGAKDMTITLMAPSKSFNIAGLAQSVAIISNSELREKFQRGMKSMGMMHMSSFAIAGFSAAYECGGEWLSESLKYIEKNVEFTIEYLKENLPQVKAHKIEGTYLMWFDLTYFSDDRKVIDDLLLNKGKVLLDPGIDFGKVGDRFYRINVGCPKCMLEDALNRIKIALS